jgi:hypothetical protein
MKTKKRKRLGLRRKYMPMFSEEKAKNKAEESLVSQFRAS